MEKIKKENGITLVSLVITIVIMLILAGVSINFVIGKNGLFTKAKQSVEIYKNAQDKESYQLSKIAKDMDKNTLSNKQVGDGVIVGYWETYDTGLAYGTNVSKTVKLRDISPNYDIINISFIRVKQADTETNKDGSKRVLALDFKDSLTDALDGYSINDMKNDIKLMQNNGKKILLSIGGESSSSIALSSTEDVDNLVGSFIDLIDEYGVNGFDLDLESGIDLTNYQNLEKAVRKVMQHYSNNLFISINSDCSGMVNADFAEDGNDDAIWMKISNDLADIIDLTSARYYNSGTQRGYDSDKPGCCYSRAQGTPSFITSQYERQVECSSLTDKQVGISILGYDENQDGLPKAYMSPDLIVKTIKIIKTGEYDNTITEEYPYTPIKAHKDFKSIVIWNVGYDAVTNYSMSNAIRNYIDKN